MFGLSDLRGVLELLYLGILRMISDSRFPSFLQLMINEIKNSKYQRITQTIIYLPHFISWVVIGGILVNFLSPSGSGQYVPETDQC